MAAKGGRSFTDLGGEVFQIKVRLLRVQPECWRRVLAPVSLTLRELHGVIQVAMGWEGAHLFEFHLRAARYGSAIFTCLSPDVALESFRFRKNAKFSYVYDLSDWWAHEVRIEDRLPAGARKHVPACIAGAGPCPPEDCGGPSGYHARRDEAVSWDAWSDVWTIEECAGELSGRTPIEDRSGDSPEELLERMEWARDRMAARAPYLAEEFSRGEINKRFRAGDHRQLMHQCF